MITFGYDCPYCAKKDVCFTIRHIASNVADTGKYRGLTIHNVFATCNYCFNGMSAMYVLKDSDKYINGMPAANGLVNAVNDNLVHFYNDIFEEPLLWFPEAKKPDIPEHLPVNVLQKLRGAEKLYLQTHHDEDLIEPAGTAYRKTLEVALAILDNSTDKNLNMRINQLVKNGILVQSMGDFAHRIRVLGNEATHSEILQEELVELRLFTQLFLQYTFTLPAKIPDKVIKRS